LKVHKCDSGVRHGLNEVFLLLGYNTALIGS